MRTLIVLAMLLLPAWGWALEERNGQLYGDPNRELCPDGKTCLVETSKVLTIEGFSHGPIATCDLDFKNCKILEAESFPCYQRMREAMQAMDLQFISKGYHPLGKRFGDNGAIVYKPKQWNTTMKACVEDQ